jgi:hypothetical protein
VPRRLVDEDHPRRGAAAAVPGVLLRLAMHSPKDFLAGTIAVAAIGGVVGNALFMQAGRHPSPMFGSPTFSGATAPMIPNPLPRPRPVEAGQPGDKLDPRLLDGRPAEIKPSPKPEPRAEIVDEPKPARVEVRSEPKAARADNHAGMIRNASAARPAAAAASSQNVPRPPAPVPTRDPLADLISRAR